MLFFFFQLQFFFALLHFRIMWILNNLEAGLNIWKASCVISIFYLVTSNFCDFFSLCSREHILLFPTQNILIDCTKHFLTCFSYCIVCRLYFFGSHFPLIRYYVRKQTIIRCCVYAGGISIYYMNTWRLLGMFGCLKKEYLVWIRTVHFHTLIMMLILWECIGYYFEYLWANYLCFCIVAILMISTAFYCDHKS